MGFSLVEWGLHFPTVSGLLIVVTSLLVSGGSRAPWLQSLRHVGSVTVAPGLYV